MNKESKLTRYCVRRVDYKEDEPDSKYFVLNYIHDKHSVFALLGYAESCEKEDLDFAEILRKLALKNNSIEYIINQWFIHYQSGADVCIPNSNDLNYIDALKLAVKIIYD